MDLYIYYRVPIENVQTLGERVTSMQAAITRDFGVVTALKRRPQEKDGCQTWMEVYIAVMEDFEMNLTQAVNEAGLAQLISGARHTEHFLDIPACA